MDTFSVIGVGAAAISTVAAAVATYYMATKPEPPMQDASLLCNQSIELEDGSRMSAYCPLDDFKESYYPEVTTTYEIFQRGLKQSNNGQCLGARTGPNEEFEWLSYQEVYDRAHHFGSGLLNLGIEAGQKTFIGIYCANCIEWDVCDLACSMYSMVSVPLFDTLNPSGCVYVIDHTEITTLLCDSETKLTRLLDKYEEMQCLKRIVSISKVSDELLERAKSLNVEICLFSDIVESGKSKTHDVQLPTQDDLYTICYTSGTTGVPKGVMVTHKNLQVQLSSVITSIESMYNITSADRHLSYMPLAHMFERVIHNFVFIHGAKIGFFRGDVKLLVDDLKLMQPTFFFTVPRLVNKIYDKVLLGVKASKIKSFLFNMALNSKTKELKQGIMRYNTIWDKLVFKKVAQALGGCVRFMVVSSAPLGEDVANFLRCAFGCSVTEVYGSSELCGGASSTLLAEFVPGHVGPPVAGCKIKLVDVPEMDYYAKDGQGEVCVMGAAVTQGYYNNPDKTAELLDKEGWAHTGDIGQWCSNGALKIIGRKKDIFKLSQGEYIAVEKIENVYLRCSVIMQIFVTGDSLQNYPVAVIVPDPEVLLPWASSQKLSGSITELCENEVVIDYIKKQMKDEGTRYNLCSFEQVNKIHIHDEPFTIEAGFLTPTLKNKRPTLQKQFASEIAELYKD